MKILAFESSCDETSCAVVEDGRQVLSDIISTQVPIHKKFGGVVPEIASRHHIEDVLPVAIEALEQAGCSWSDMDAIAVTQGLSSCRSSGGKGGSLGHRQASYCCQSYGRAYLCQPGTVSRSGTSFFIVGCFRRSYYACRSQRLQSL